MKTRTRTRSIKSIALITAVLFAMTFMLAACGGTGATTASGTTAKYTTAAATTAATTAAASDTGASKASGEKIKITVATGGNPKPYTYVDENNQLVGYDIDLIREIFKNLPQYEVAFEKTEFASIFAGLDSDRYQIGANHFGMNDKRKENTCSPIRISKTNM